jgi:hypothetical protein
LKEVGVVQGGRFHSDWFHRIFGAVPLPHFKPLLAFSTVAPAHSARFHTGSALFSYFVVVLFMQSLGSVSLAGFFGTLGSTLSFAFSSFCLTLERQVQHFQSLVW